MRSYIAIVLTACSSSAAHSAVPESSGPIEVQCESGAVTVHFDRSCERDSDCVLAGATIDCCGTEQVIGIAVGERSRWNAQDAPCGTRVGICECAAETSLADDGTRGERASTVCRDRVCTTTFAAR